MKKRFGKAAAVMLVVMLAVWGAAGCGGGASSADSGGVSYGKSVPQAATSLAEETMAETAAAYVTEAGSYDGAFDAAATEIPVPDEKAAGAGTESGGNNGQKDSRAGRKLIRTVNLSVETTEFETLLGKISQAVESDGGYIEQSDVSGNSMSYSGASHRYAYLTVRIPSGKLDGFLNQVAEQSNVINRSESVEDVTLQYTDVESRKKSLTIEQERLWELLEQADSVDSIIALESRLSEIRYQLEGYESQLRTYDNQVDYSTVCIDIQEVGVFTPTEPDSVLIRIQKGFKRNLENVGTGLVDLFVWFVSSLPLIVLLLILLALVWLIVRAVGRKGAARRVGKKEKNQKLNLPILKGSRVSQGTEPQKQEEPKKQAETQNQEEAQK